MAVGQRQLIVSLGVHIVDILGRPVTHIPPGQGRQLLDEIKITAAGTAAGTSVDLAKLGADVVAMGAVGDDQLADFLISVLGRHGIETRLLVRKSGVQTSATMLPIRPNGERPALHSPGATALLTLADIDLETIASASVLHVGGPDVLGAFGGEPLRTVLATAKRHGVTTTMDVLTPGDAMAWSGLRPLLAFVDYFLPNEEQLSKLTGTGDIGGAARMVLAYGAQAVLVSRGEHGCSLVTSAGRVDYPAFPAQVVDTTGCGDACSAGFIVGLLRGWTLEDVPWLAMAAASLVVGGLGSDAGIVDLNSTLDVIRQHAPQAVARRFS